MVNIYGVRHNTGTEILDERIKKMEIGGGVTNNIENETPSPEIIYLENKWEGELGEVEARVEGREVFEGGRCFRSQSEYEDFSRDHILDFQFKWFIDIVSYLKFVTGETVSTAEYQRDAPPTYFLGKLSLGRSYKQYRE